MASTSFQPEHETVNKVRVDTPVSGLTVQLPPVGAVFTSRSRNDIPCSPDAFVTTTPARYWVSPLNRTKPSWNSRSDTAILRDWQPAIYHSTPATSHHHFLVLVNFVLSSSKFKSHTQSELDKNRVNKKLSCRKNKPCDCCEGQFWSNITGRRYSANIRFIFSHIDVISRQSYRIRWSNAK